MFDSKFVAELIYRMIVNTFPRFLLSEHWADNYTRLVFNSNIKLLLKIVILMIMFTYFGFFTPGIKNNYYWFWKYTKKTEIILQIFGNHLWSMTYQTKKEDWLITWPRIVITKHIRNTVKLKTSLFESRLKIFPSSKMMYLPATYSKI